MNWETPTKGPVFFFWPASGHLFLNLCFPLLPEIWPRWRWRRHRRWQWCQLAVGVLNGLSGARAKLRLQWLRIHHQCRIQWLGILNDYGLSHPGILNGLGVLHRVLFCKPLRCMLIMFDVFQITVLRSRGSLFKQLSSRGDWKTPQSSSILSSGVCSGCVVATEAASSRLPAGSAGELGAAEEVGPGPS